VGQRLCGLDGRNDGIAIGRFDGHIGAVVIDEPVEGVTVEGLIVGRTLGVIVGFTIGINDGTELGVPTVGEGVMMMVGEIVTIAVG